VNRLEVAGTLGRVTVEEEGLRFVRNDTPSDAYSRTATTAFTAPGTTETWIAAPGGGPQHVGILQNFADAILRGQPLVAPAREGIHSVELANAMLLSGWLGTTVDLPIDAARYAELLGQRIARSRRKTTLEPDAPAADFAASFGRP
jgi:predicted dehydrogenase